LTAQSGKGRPVFNTKLSSKNPKPLLAVPDISLGWEIKELHFSFLILIIIIIIFFFFFFFFFLRGHSKHPLPWAFPFQQQRISIDHASSQSKTGR
jgi:RsiW-degrading membrane proteinase PrsW (M82 family)